MYFGTLLSSLFKLFLFVVLGYIIKKINLVTEKTTQELSDVLLKVIVPCSVISSGFEGKGNDIKSVGLSFLIITLCYIFFFILSFAFLKRVFKDEKMKNTAVNMCVFANTGFIGLPLTQVLCGSEGMIYAVIYNLMYNVFMFTYGIRLISGETKHKLDWKSVLLDPLIIASVVSIALFLAPIEDGGVIEEFFSAIGSMSGTLSIMLIGSWLIGLNLKSIMTKPLCYAVSVLRLLVFPLLVYLVLYLLKVDLIMKNTIVLISALPVGALNVVLAKKYNTDVSFANETMMQTLVLSVVTIPLLVLLF